MADNKLFYGDNLEVLRDRISSESVDLIYLDPPFNSARNYNVLFGRNQKHTAEDAAQMQAFGDTWVWTPTTEQQYLELIQGALPSRAADAMTAFRTLLGENDAMAYLVKMAPRLVELHRVLRATGSIYLHCDPTMSHYLKVMLDAIFGAQDFRNEIIWKRTSSHSSAKKYAPVHDVLLYYGKSSSVTWNSPRTAYTKEYLNKYYRFDDGDGRLYWRADLCAAGVRKGRSGLPWRGFDPTAKGMHWKFAIDKLDGLDAEGRLYWPKGGSGWPQYKRYRDELPGKAVSDIWDDIDKINPVGSERLGYPTQKPVALLQRVLEASSNEGDVVLDPFCGCGTTVDAAQSLKRKWVGIDVTYIAVDLIRKRLRHTYGDEVEGSYDVLGIPRDRAGAFALFSQSPFDFERWAVSLVNAQPNEKQVGDKGIDGVARFFLDGKGQTLGRILVSVKGGKTIGPQFVRDLIGTVETQKAEMGVLITMTEPTRGIVDAVNHAGTYTHPANGQKFPKVQVVTVDQLLKGERPSMPLTTLPHIEAKRARVANTDEGLF